MKIGSQVDTALACAAICAMMDATASRAQPGVSCSRAAPVSRGPRHSDEGGLLLRSPAQSLTMECSLHVFACVVLLLGACSGLGSSRSTSAPAGNSRPFVWSVIRADSDVVGDDGGENTSPSSSIGFSVEPGESAPDPISMRNTDEGTGDAGSEGQVVQEETKRYSVASVEFTRVETPFIIGVWIFSASLAKIGECLSSVG